MPLPLAIPIIAAIAGLGLQANSSRMSGNAADEQLEFQEETQKTTEARMKKEALANLLGANVGYKPMPIAPDMTSGRQAIAASDFGASLANMFAAKTGDMVKSGEDFTLKGLL